MEINDWPQLHFMHYMLQSTIVIVLITIIDIILWVIILGTFRGGGIPVKWFNIVDKRSSGKYTIMEILDHVNLRWRRSEHSSDLTFLIRYRQVASAAQRAVNCCRERRWETRWEGRIRKSTSWSDERVTWRPGFKASRATIEASVWRSWGSQSCWC